MSMTHAHVLRESWTSLRILKYETIAWWKSGLCMIWIFCVGKMEHSQNIWLCRDNLLWLCYLIRHNCLVSTLEVLLFLCQHQTFILNHIDSEHSCHSKKNYIEIMLSSIPHQKFCFYHLPTRGRAGIKLGDAWYVSNVSIIFYCSMLLYYLFRMFNEL